MQTGFKSAPAFFSAETWDKDLTVPKGMMRINTITIESYLIPIKDDSMDNIQFKILAAQAEDSKMHRSMLLRILDHLQGNLRLIKGARPKN